MDKKPALKELISNFVKTSKEWSPISGVFWQETHRDLIKAGYSLKQIKEIGHIVSLASIKSISKGVEIFKTKQ